MNQDFTVQKKQYLSEKKNSCRGVHLKKNCCTSSERKKKFVQAENSPPPPITFLMVRPLGEFSSYVINSSERSFSTYL